MLVINSEFHIVTPAITARMNKHFQRYKLPTNYWVPPGDDKGLGNQSELPLSFIKSISDRQDDHHGHVSTFIDEA